MAKPAAVAILEILYKLPPPMAAAPRTTRLFVRPVKATPDISFTNEPEAANVLRFIGVLPVEMALLPVEVHHMNTPGPVDVNAVRNTCRFT